MPTAEHRLAMAQALMYAAGWALDEAGDVDQAYLTGCQETAGHLLACYLTQHGGHECCETAVGRDLIPWGDLPKTVGEWEAFLEGLERRPQTYQVAVTERRRLVFEVQALGEEQAKTKALRMKASDALLDEQLDDLAEVLND